MMISDISQELSPPAHSCSSSCTVFPQMHILVLRKRICVHFLHNVTPMCYIHLSVYLCLMGFLLELPYLTYSNMHLREYGISFTTASLYLSFGIIFSCILFKQKCNQLYVVPLLGDSGRLRLVSR